MNSGKVRRPSTNREIKARNTIGVISTSNVDKDKVTQRGGERDMDAYFGQIGGQRGGQRRAVANQCVPVSELISPKDRYW